MGTERASMIGNRDALIESGNTQQRDVVLEVVEETLRRVHPDTIVANNIHTDGDGVLSIDDRTWDLTEYDDIYVIGVGKGSIPLTEAIVDVVDTDLKEVLAIEKRGQTRVSDSVTVIESDHPVPTQSSIDAGNRIRQIASHVRPTDLVIFAITGGASALMAAPTGDISLQDLRAVTEELLRAGAPIEEINTVRKHLSDLKGGNLVTRFDCPILGLIVVDEVQGEVWGPTVPDTTTFQDAIDVLKRRDIWDSTPDSVRSHLKKGLDSPEMETPTEDDLEGYPVTNVVLANAEDLCTAAQHVAAEHGIDAYVLSSVLEGESRDAGIVLASIAAEVAERDRPFVTPCLLISGGETTVTVDNPAGMGGPNQELVLAFARKIADKDGITAVSIGTDGTDGPTDIAGGIVDTTTLSQLERRDVDVHACLDENNSSIALQAIDAAIVLDSLTTNLMDLRLILIE